jgi:hypothetical protein
MARVDVEADALSREMLIRIRGMALEEVRLLDQLAAALRTGDMAHVVNAARELVGLKEKDEQ